MLEIMITKAPHEFYKTMLAKLIETIILELDTSGAVRRFDDVPAEGLGEGLRARRVLVDRRTKRRCARSGSLIFNATRRRTWRSK